MTDHDPSPENAHPDEGHTEEYPTIAGGVEAPTESAGDLPFEEQADDEWPIRGPARGIRLGRARSRHCSPSCSSRPASGEGPSSRRTTAARPAPPDGRRRRFARLRAAATGTGTTSTTRRRGARGGLPRRLRRVDGGCDGNDLRRRRQHPLRPHGGRGTREGDAQPVDDRHPQREGAADRPPARGHRGRPGNGGRGRQRHGQLGHGDGSRRERGRRLRRASARRRRGRRRQRIVGRRPRRRAASVADPKRPAAAQVLAAVHVGLTRFTAMSGTRGCGGSDTAARLMRLPGTVRIDARTRRTRAHVRARRHRLRLELRVDRPAVTSTTTTTTSTHGRHTTTDGTGTNATGTNPGAAFAAYQSCLQAHGVTLPARGGFFRGGGRRQDDTTTTTGGTTAARAPEHPVPAGRR